jgi:hypothetical protein
LGDAYCAVGDRGAHSFTAIAGDHYRAIVNQARRSLNTAFYQRSATQCVEHFGAL